MTASTILAEIFEQLARGKEMSLSRSDILDMCFDASDYPSIDLCLAVNELEDHCMPAIATLIIPDIIEKDDTLMRLINFGIRYVPAYYVNEHPNVWSNAIPPQDLP